MLHLSVAQSNAEWCASPCQGPTWELAAPKADTASPYVLLEAAIWRQERRVALYRFEPSWAERARRAYYEVCSGQGWECPYYRVFREGSSLLNVGPWPEALDEDPKKLSEFLLDAFLQVFAKAREVGAGAKSMVLSYSGHGARADGSLFEGALRTADAVSLLQQVTGQSSGGQLSILNFGGNCAEGRWNMLQPLHSFATWIVASDLKVGGVKMTDEENTNENMQARESLQDLSVMKVAGEKQLSVRDTVASLVSARQKLWDTVWKGPILRQGLPQSVAAYETQHFADFASALAAKYAALDPEARGKLQDWAEAHDCDVLMTARFLDGGGQSATLLQRAADTSGEAVSLLAAARHLHSRRAWGSAAGPLEAKFEALRPMYASTRTLVEWTVQAYGLGFNFLSWNDKPPCDLASAVGRDAPPPPGGWHTEG